jgi:CheY-like chemotaxis protein
MATDVSGTPVPRALVVDDESAVRTVLRRWLNRRGWQVDEAADGLQALTLLEGATDEYDVVICDLRMPALDGPDLHRWIASHRPALLPHLVFASGDTNDAAAHAFLAATGCLVLEKPFELSTLAALVLRARTGSVGLS